MHFGFALELSNVDLLNIDLLDTHLDLLDTGIPSRYFAFLHNVFKTSSRHVFKKSSRRLQRNNFSFSKTSSRRLARCLQNVFKTSLQDVFKTSWKTQNCYAEDVQDQQMFAGREYENLNSVNCK